MVMKALQMVAAVVVVELVARNGGGRGGDGMLVRH